MTTLKGAGEPVAEREGKVAMGGAQFHVDEMQETIGASPARRHIDDRVSGGNFNRPINLLAERFQGPDVDDRLTQGLDTLSLRRVKIAEVLGGNEAGESVKIEIRTPPIRSGNAKFEGDIVPDRRLDRVLANRNVVSMSQVAVDQPDVGPGFVAVEQVGVRADERVKRIDVGADSFPFPLSQDPLFMRYDPKGAVGVGLGESQSALRFVFPIALRSFGNKIHSAGGIDQLVEERDLGAIVPVDRFAYPIEIGKRPQRSAMPMEVVGGEKLAWVADRVVALSQLLMLIGAVLPIERHVARFSQSGFPFDAIGGFVAIGQ